MKRQLFIYALVLLASSTSFSQQDPFEKIVKGLQSFNEKNYAEKVYITTDTDVYFAGENIWFTARLFDNRFLSPSTKSTIVHVKLLGDHGELVHQKIKIDGGTGNGNIQLSDTLSSGHYTLVGYSNWMKNFDAENFFYKRLLVSNHKKIDTTSINYSPKIKKILFFPEGGTFVNDLSNRVGFKCVDANGSGANTSGFIIDDKADTLLFIRQTHQGIGSFELTPEKNQNYYFVTEDSARFALPKPTEGVSLSIHPITADRLAVKIEKSKKYKSHTNKIVLFAQSRGVITYGAKGNLRSSDSEIDISKLRAGVNQFVVFDESGQLLATRLYFVPPSQENFSVQTKSQKDGTIEVILEDKASEKNTNLSISVHDRQPFGESIISSMLLTSQIDGFMKNPNFYITDESSFRQIDNLMLVSSSTMFDWENIYDQNIRKTFDYQAEATGIFQEGQLLDSKTGKAIQDSLLIISKIGFNPSILFLNHNEPTFSIPFGDTFGVKDVMVNVFGNPDFRKYKFVPTKDKIVVPDSFKGLETQDKSQFEKYARAHKLEEQILTNYRHYLPDVYSKEIEEKPTTHFDNTLIRNPYEVVLPEEYITLNSTEEVITEIVLSAHIRKRKGKKEIFVLEDELVEDVRKVLYHDEPSMPVVNGVLVFDSQILLDVPYQKIEKVAVFDGTYEYLDKTFNGFLALTTNDLESKRNFLFDSPAYFKLHGISKQPKAFDDEISLNQKLPDLRHLLYWNPNTTFEKGEIKFNFKPSDISQEVFLVIEGITEDGNPIYYSEKILVR